MSKTAYPSQIPEIVQGLQELAGRGPAADERLRGERVRYPVRGAVPGALFCGEGEYFLRVEVDTAGEGKGQFCGLRRGPCHSGQQIGGCARRVSWSVGAARVTEVCLKELCEIGMLAACGFLLGARCGWGNCGCPQKPACHTGNVKFCMSRPAPRRQCLLQRLCVCRFCVRVVPAEEWSVTLLAPLPLAWLQDPGKEV